MWFYFLQNEAINITGADCTFMFGAGGCCCWFLRLLERGLMGGFGWVGVSDAVEDSEKEDDGEC